MTYNRVLILTFPKIALDAPPLAAALLSSICKQHNIDYDFVDCNLDFHQQLTDKPFKDEILGLYAEMFIDKLSEPAQNWVDQYFCSLEKKCQQFDLVAISVFSQHSMVLVHDFLKKHRPQFNAQVVIGGGGIRTEYGGDVTFYQNLKKQQLIDYWILGEGEVGFTDLLLEGNNSKLIGDTINNSVPANLQNFDLVPVPDFDKFRLDDYRYGHKKIIGVEGSRGCVKKCTFCNIQHTWGAFKFKDGKKLAKELLYLKEKYDIDHFWFNDSLINGSLKAFREFVENLANDRKEDAFTWSSQAIIRSRSASDERDFQLMRNSGCETLAVGLESFSQKVRWHMNKKFTDDDVEHFFNLAQKYNITVFLMMIIGYPTETEEDFQHALRQLEKYQYLADDGTIGGIRIGSTMNIGPNHPIFNMMEKTGIKYIDNSPNKSVTWVCSENTLKKRVEWRIRFEDHARQLGYTCYDAEMSIEQTLLKFLANME
jgi:hypothetical protein